MEGNSRARGREFRFVLLFLAVLTRAKRTDKENFIDAPYSGITVLALVRKVGSVG